MVDTRLRSPAKVSEVLKKAVQEIDRAAAENAPVAVGPGEIVRGEKVPWTMKELLKRPEGRTVSFIPEENIRIQWNELEWYLREGVEFSGPWIVQYEYSRVRALRRKAGRNAITQGMGFEVQRVGDGPLPPPTTTE